MVHPGGSRNSPRTHPGLFGGLLALLLAGGGSKRMSEKFSHTVYASLFSINRIIPKYTHASSLSGRNS
jgi:hypothetical protein